MNKSVFYQYNKKAKIKDVVFTPIEGVKLGEGLFNKVFNRNISFLISFKLEDLSYWFDVKAGRKAKGNPYRGHFEDNLKGQTAFEVLMGAGNALRWGKDENLEKIVDDIIQIIEETSDKDGYCMAIDRKFFARREYPHYVRIWLTYGLLAVAYSGSGKGLEILERWQKWFNSSRELPIIKYLELAFQGIVASTAAYFSPIGSKRDLEVVEQYYEEDWRLAQFMRMEPNCIQKRIQPGLEPHAHGSEIESLEGYLDMFRATGAYYYLDSVMGAIEMYKKHWQHAGGGIVMCEFLDSEEDSYILDPSQPYNELCCSSFWLYLHQRLHRLFPNVEEYVGQIESSLYNIAIANQNEDKTIRYFAVLEGCKEKGMVNSCCAGVGTRIYGSLPEFIFSVNENDIYVDIYSSATLSHEKAKIQIETDMPYSYMVNVSVLNVKGPFKLHLRIPSWVKAPFEISGKLVTPGSYCEFDITKDCNFSFTFPVNMIPHLYEGKESIPGYKRVGYLYGPLLLSFVGPKEYRYGKIFSLTMEGYDSKAPETWLEPTDKPLVWKVKGKKDAYLMPYMDIGCNKNFVTYPIFNN